MRSTAPAVFILSEEVQYGCCAIQKLVVSVRKRTFVPHERERKIVRGERRRGELPCWSYTESALPPAEVYCGKLMQLPKTMIHLSVLLLIILLLIIV